MSVVIVTFKRRWFPYCKLKNIYELRFYLILFSVAGLTIRNTFVMQVFYYVSCLNIIDKNSIITFIAYARVSNYVPLSCAPHWVLYNYLLDKLSTKNV